MAFAYLAHVIKQGTADGSGNSAGIDTTGADLIVICCCDIVVATVSDNKGNTWTPRTRYTQGGGAGVTLFYCVSPTVGSGHTFAAAAFGSYASISVAAFSGVKLTSPYDVENGAAVALATSLATGSVTPSEDNELLVYGFGDAWVDAASVSVGAITDQLVILGGNSFANAMGYEIQTTATARNPSWSVTTSSRMCANIATFKAAASGAAFMPRRGLRLNQTVNRASTY